MTPFVRLLVVFHFLRQALGTQSTPSNQTLIGLALILTYFLMQPVGNAINSAAVVPFERGSVTALQAVEIGAGPLRHFMIKYSSAQVDERRIGQLAMAIQGAFQDLGVFQGSPIRGLSDQTSLTQVTIAKREGMASHVLSAPAPSDGSGSDDEAVTKLRQELTEALSAEISEQKIALRHEPNGLVISLREVGFFDSGSAQIKPESLSAFDRIATILRDKKYPLRIEGHTDDVPIHTSQFASNWELSAARATELVRTLIVRNGFPADRLSAGGFAEFHPVATNQTRKAEHKIVESMWSYSNSRRTPLYDQHQPSMVSGLAAYLKAGLNAKSTLLSCTCHEHSFRRAPPCTLQTYHAEYLASPTVTTVGVWQEIQSGQCVEHSEPERD